MALIGSLFVKINGVWRQVGTSSTSPPPANVGSISSLAAVAGKGTTTLSWQETGNMTTVRIYRDSSIVTTIDAGVKTYTSPLIPDGLYQWSVVPVNGSTAGTSANITFGNMYADVWVDTTNGNDSNNGSTPQLAVKTLRRGGQLMNANGKIMAIRGGTYYEYNAKDNGGSTYGSAPVTTFTRDNSSSNPCYIKSFPGEYVIIDGSSITRPLGSGATDPQRPELFSIMGDYWVFTGWPGYPIELRNSAGSGFRTRLTTGVKVFYVHSHNHEGSAFNMQTAYNWEIGYCAGWSVFSTVNDGETADGVSTGGGNNGVVHDCFFAWCGDDGVDFITSSNMVCYNTVVYQSGYHKGRIPNNGNGNGFKMSGVSSTTHNNLFYNCIAYDCRVLGFTFNTGSAKAYNCTAINNYIGFSGNNSPNGVWGLKNCVGYNNTSNNYYPGNSTPAFNETNSWNVPGVTVNAADFQNLTFNESWRSWDEVVAAKFVALASNSDLKGKGKEGQDLGYEGQYLG